MANHMSSTRNVQENNNIHGVELRKVEEAESTSNRKYTQEIKRKKHVFFLHVKRWDRKQDTVPKGGSISQKWAQKQ